MLDSLWNLREKMANGGFTKPYCLRVVHPASSTAVGWAPKRTVNLRTLAANAPVRGLIEARMVGSRGEKRYLGGVCIMDTTRNQPLHIPSVQMEFDGHIWREAMTDALATRITGAQSSGGGSSSGGGGVDNSLQQTIREHKELLRQPVVKAPMNEMDEEEMPSGDSGVEDPMQCVVCCDRMSDIKFLTCGHLCVCRLCYIRLPMKWGNSAERKHNELFKSCPLCRANIDTIEYIW